METKFASNSVEQVDVRHAAKLSSMSVSYHQNHHCVLPSYISHSVHRDLI